MHKNLNILIIEDSYDDFELYTRILKKILTCDITHCVLAEHAIELFTQKKRFDLILLDYNLPRMNGIQFLNTLKENHLLLLCPVIVLTGEGNEDIVVDFMRLGVTDYITKKMVSSEHFPAIVNKSLKKYQEKKKELQKQNELLLFAHTLAHDLKSPISRVLMYSKLLEKNPQKQHEYIKNIQEDSEFLTGFIDTLLSYAEAGRSQKEPKPVDCNTIAQKSIKNLEIEITKKNAKIIMDKLPTVYGCDISLIQMFQNIISNSIKYCLKTPIIEISSSIKDNGKIISIKDNGIGIPQNKLESVFKPFTRISNETDASGLGLGLALVKSIVDQHKAKINITSTEGEGSRFDIIFPHYYGLPEVKG